MSRLPSLLSLRAFEAAARRGSIKEAASELAVTPGAVSQQIKALEADLGVRLFVRKTRAIHLTPEGQHLQPTISESFLQIRQIVDQVRPKAAPKFRIQSTNALISKWLLPRLHRFTKSHPETQVHIESEATFERDAETAADVEIRYARTPPEGCYSEVLHRERMLVVASPALLEIYGVKTPDDIKAAPVLNDRGFLLAGSLSSWEYWGKRAGLVNVVDPTKIVMFENPPGGQMVDAAIAGVGLAICGSMLVYAALADGRLVCPFGPIVESERNYYICCRPGRENDPMVKEFMVWAQREAAMLTTLNALLEAPGVH